ncbi:hypothetical protein MUO98_05825 [Candidatus Bathyarchaeota archaeon]|jgi:Tfp pilus assembly protein PilE|nr:hypothetical protein [Candidatus Bathyarchaeota archaeon]
MEQIKLNKAQGGLTLLQILLIAAIIGILAELALSAYEDYVAQEKVTKQ